MIYYKHPLADIKCKRSEKMLALEEITRKLGPYKAKLIEMGDSL